MDGEAVREVERITRAAAGHTVEIDGKVYSTTPLHDPRKPSPEPKTLRFWMLQGLVAYLLAEALDEARDCFVHVVNACHVQVVSGLFGEFRQRQVLAEAVYDPPVGLPFGQFMHPEQFTIGLQACFVPTEGRTAVLATTGSLAAQAVQQLDDDGVSQQVTVKTGAVRLAERKVPNPVMLSPMAAFPEVEQVERPFVLRLRGGGDSGPPMCALFEADGGAWERTAVERIAEWLCERLSTQYEIFA